MFTNNFYKLFRLALVIAGLFSLFFLNACLYNKEEENPEFITLIWYNAPMVQTETELRTGLHWMLSYLGAAVTESEKAIQIRDGKIRLNIGRCGFSETSLTVLKKIIFKLKDTDEYREKDGIDAGRFFGIIFNSSWQYYAITGAAPNYASFKNAHNYALMKQLALDSSSIASEGRLIRYHAAGTNLTSNFFDAEEGNGFFGDSSFVSLGYHEVFDYMPNGQPRFAVYSGNGNLVAGNDHIFSQAGKPAKCMWCHESKMQPLFKPSPDIPGYTSNADFDADQKKFNALLQNFHATNKSALVFSNAQDHSQGEIIYLNFFEPNAARLALEWDLSLAEVIEKLKTVATHTNPEFPAFKELYHRAEIESFSPFQTLNACGYARDISGYEPNYTD